MKTTRDLLLLFLLAQIYQITALAQMAGVIGFTSADYPVSERDGEAIITVTRDWEFGMAAVDVVIADDTAENGTHFTVATTNTLVFSNFQTSVSFTIALTDDAEANEARVANMALENPRLLDDEDSELTPELEPGFEAATLTILDEDGELQVFLGKTWYSVAEGGAVTVEVLLSEPVTAEDQGVEVDYELLFNGFPTRAGSSEASASDIVTTNGTSGTLAFAEGEQMQTITIEAVEDNLVEFNEDLQVALTGVRGERVPAGGGTDGGTDGGTGAALTAAAEPGGTAWALGAVATANVTILFNGSTNQAQPAGAVDQLFNVANDQQSDPPFNPAPGANNTVFAAATTADGKTIIGGEFTSVNAYSRSRIARLLANGSVDQAFNPPGGANDYVSSVAVYTNGPLAGKILIGGGFTAVNGVQRNGIARLNENGTLDTQFNPGLGANGPVYSVSVQSDGAVLIGGDFTSVNGVPRNRVARLLPNGGVDLNFDPGTGANGPVYAVLAQLASSITVTNGITNGVPELQEADINAGAVSGFVTLDFSFRDTTNNILVMQDGQVLFDSGLIMTPVIVTTNATNGVDTEFGFIRTNIAFNGQSPIITILVNTLTNASSNWVYRATVQPNVVGPVYIAGDFSVVDDVPAGRVAKLGANGAVDETYTLNAGLGADDTVNALGLQRDGSLILGGAFSTVNSFPSPGVARLTPSGMLDPNFSVGYGADDIVQAVQVTSDDRILIGGRFTSYNGTRRLMLARLLPNGFLDTSFMDSAYNQYAGFPDPDGAMPVSVINAIAVKTADEPEDRRVVVGGSFSHVGGGETRTDFQIRMNVAQLHGGETDGPGNVAFDQQIFGADENGLVMNVLVSRSNGTLGLVDVLFLTEDGGATEGEDYVGMPNGAVGRIPATGFGILPITILDDELIEGDEDFQIRLLMAAGVLVLGGEYILPGAALGDVTDAAGIILENDVPQATVQFATAEYDFNENDGTVTIDVVREGNTSRALSVRYGLGTYTGTNAAVVNEDFFPFSGTVSFASGQTSRSFTVRLRDDAVVEPDETLVMELSLPSSGAVLGTNAVAALNIIDNDYAPGRVSLTATNYVSVEGGAAVVTVKRTGGNVGVLQVDYSTEDGSASAPFDYQPRSGRLTWNDRESSAKTITIPIGENGLVEGNKEFSISLSNPNPSGGLGLRTSATIVITENDAYGSFSFNAAEFLADENGTNVIVNVIRRGGDAETATVEYRTVDDTATAGEDYESASGTLTFAMGETSKSFLVPLIDNSEADGERVLQLELSNPAPEGASLGLLTNATIAIIDNESFNIPAGSPETDSALGSGANDAVHAITVDSNGRILIGGDFTVVNRQVRTHLARLAVDGSLDPFFGASLEIDGSVRDLAVQGDGRILIAGAFENINGLPANYLARLSSGGLLDGTFNTGAGADNPIFAVEAFTTAAGEQKVLIGGSFSRFNGVDRRGLAQVSSDGRTDTSFDPGAGVNGTVYAIVRQRDGKILVGGDFVSIGGEPRLNIARLNADGSVDETFNPGLGADGSVRSILVQYDDRIVIGGLFETYSDVSRVGIARLNTDGTLDASFDPGSGANGAIYALALQLDGKIVAGGEFTEFNGVPNRRVVRLNHDGSVDTTINFGQGANGFVAAVGIQPDRRILLGGGFTEFDGLERNHFVRVYGGSVSGVGELEFAQADYQVLENGTEATITVRRTGGLEGTVAVDYETIARTAEPNADYENVSGTLSFAPGENQKQFIVPLVDDTVAEPNEIVDLELSNATGGATLIRQPIATLTIVSDDSVIGFTEALYTASENAAGGNAVITVQREGELSFPASIAFSTVTDGTAQSPADFTSVSGVLDFAPGQAVRAFTVPIVDDGEVEENETVSLELIPLDPNQPVGRIRAVLTILDNDFAPGILSLTGSPRVTEGGGTVAITVVRTSGRTGAVTVNYALRNGTAVSGQDFIGSSGVITFNEGETAKSISVPVLQDSLVEGTEFFVAELSNPTGGAVLDVSVIAVEIVDDDFGPGSFDTSFAVGSGARPVYSMDLQPDGKILLAGGFTTFNGTGRGRVTRVLPDGSLDENFSPAGGLNDTAYSVVLQPDGKVAVGGAFSTFGGIPRPYAGRFLTNGFPDVALNLPAGQNGLVRSVAAQSDEKLILGGDFTTPTRGVLRINQNGSLDVSFDPEGGANGNVYSVALQANGRVLVGGEFTTFGETAARSLVRLWPNGLVDSSFAIGTGINGRVNAITIAPDGKILVGGSFTSVNGVGRSGIARLNDNGSVDLGFAPELAPNGPIYDIEVFLDKVYIVGDFTQLGATQRNRIARLNSDGTLDESFDPGLGADGPVHAVELQTDGQILVAGNFDSVNGFFSPGVARLNGDQGGQPQDVSIQSVRTEGGEMVLTYSTQAGRSYVVEGSSDLQNWETLAKEVANSTSAEFRELADESHRFYRIHIE